MSTRREEWPRLPGEDPIDPNQPTCDSHHHLWDYPDDLPESNVPPFARYMRHYLLGELLEDTGGGHRIEQTVFMECRSMYRKEGPQELCPVGETEFVQGICDLCDGDPECVKTCQKANFDALSLVKEPQVGFGGPSHKLFARKPEDITKDVAYNLYGDIAEELI